LDTKLTEFTPSYIYSKLIGSQPTQEELQLSRSFISSILYSVITKKSGDDDIDTKWLDTQSDTNVSTNILESSQTVLSGMTPNPSKEQESEVDNLLASSNKPTDLSQTIATAIESALKSKTSIDNTLTHRGLPVNSLYLSSVVSTDSIENKDLSQTIATAIESTLKLNLSINTPDQASGFLLVCPSSKQVVGILNIDKSIYENQTCSFLYDEDFSTNKTYSKPFESLDLENCISKFISNIDKIIANNSNICKTAVTVNQTDRLSSLFASAFMSVITNPTIPAKPLLLPEVSSSSKSLSDSSSKSLSKSLESSSSIIPSESS
jgi:hypothetical protein